MVWLRAHHCLFLLCRGKVVFMSSAWDVVFSAACSASSAFLSFASDVYFYLRLLCGCDDPSLACLTFSIVPRSLSAVFCCPLSRNPPGEPGVGAPAKPPLSEDEDESEQRDEAHYDSVDKASTASEKF